MVRIFKCKYLCISYILSIYRITRVTSNIQRIIINQFSITNKQTNNEGIIRSFVFSNSKQHPNEI